MKSVFIIINDKYVLLEKELNELKKEKDLKIREMEELQSKIKNKCSLNKEFTSCNCINSDGAAFKVEKLVAEIKEQLENEFDYLKTQFCNSPKTTIYSVFDYLNCELENMEEQISKGLCQVNEICMSINVMMNGIPEDADRLVNHCNTMCDLFTESELEKENLRFNFLDLKHSLTELQNENISLQSRLDGTNIRLKNYKIASKGLHNTIHALSKRLVESSHEVERLNKLIRDNRLIENIQDTRESSNLFENVYPSIDSNFVYKKLNDCLIQLKNIVNIPQSNIQSSKLQNPDHPLEIGELLLQLNNILVNSTKNNDMLSFVQMENNSLRLQLTDAMESLSELETKKTEKDIQLNEYTTKINEQVEIIDKQAQTISSLHILLNHQHEDMVRIHKLQTITKDEENVTSLEEKLETKNQEIINLKYAYEELLEHHDILFKQRVVNNQMKFENEHRFRNHGELVLYVCNLEQIIKELETQLNIEKGRNVSLELEITKLKSTIKQYEEENKKIQKKELNNIFQKEENELLKENQNYFTLKAGTYNKMKVSNSKQSPVLKEINK